MSVQPFLAFVALCFLSSSVFARGERMGEFRFSEVHISPRAYVQEPSQGSFTLEQSWLSVEWKKDESFSGEIKFGTSDLNRPALFYTRGNQTPQLTLTEAYVQAKSKLVDVRVGLMQIPSSYENSVPEWEWYLPATVARREVWFPIRDYGLNFELRHLGYVTTASVYNGESQSNFDNRLFYTASWSYLNYSGWGWLLTGTVGSAGPQSTAGAQAEIDRVGFNLDVNESFSMRYGSLAVYRKWNRSIVLAEYARGDWEQSDEKRPWAWGHFDVSYNLGGDLNMLLRYEQLQADLKRSETIRKSSGFGLAFSSADRLSSMTLFAIKNEEELKLNNDELWLIFKLNSNLL